MFESAHSNSVPTKIVVFADQGQDVMEINGKYEIFFLEV